MFGTDLAVGVWPTRVPAAGVRAAVVDAGVGLRAVAVGAAAHDAHLVETDVAEETVIVDPTRNCGDTDVTEGRGGTVQEVKPARHTRPTNQCDQHDEPTSEHFRYSRMQSPCRQRSLMAQLSSEVQGGMQIPSAHCIGCGQSDELQRK